MNIETPEGVELLLTPAGPGPRILAYLIDGLIRLLLLGLLALGLTALDLLGQGLFLIAYFLLEWFYPVWFELRKGATPGKRAFGLRVLRDDGSAPRLGDSMLRNLLRAVDFLPLAYGLGLVAMLMRRDFKRLGDMVAGTLVVYDPPKPARPKLDPVLARPSPHALTLDEQRAVIAFAERCAQISPSRQEELARVLEPVLYARGEAAVTLLKGIANGLVGRHNAIMSGPDKTAG